MSPADLCRRVDPDRLADLTWRLVRIASPTGSARACTEAYAAELAALGLEVTLEAGAYPDHPSAVARLRGGPGPCLQLNAHTDTVPLPHPPAEKLPDRVVGRGAADMKGSLACMAEVARLLVEAGLPLPGDLLLTAHDLHEAPGGLGETVTDLCRRGIHGDVCVVTEGGSEDCPLVGRGMAIFELTVRRDGELAHEVTGVPNPIGVMTEIMAALQSRRDAMAARREPYVGPETVFIGQAHAGAFYNQIPTEAFLNGTWRFSPSKTFDDARKELDELLDAVVLPAGMGLERRFFEVRPSFAVAESEPLVGALRRAYRAVHGRELPLAGARAVCDVPIFGRVAGVPCLGHGPVGHGAHGEPEWVAIDALVVTTQVYLRLLAEFWGC